MGDVMKLKTVSRTRNAHQKGYSTLAVQYRDGLTLTYIFERSTKITDLMAAIGRAGQVLKVVLWDELPTGSTRKALP